MSLIYLLDTNTISEPLKPAPHPQVMARLERCYSQIALPALAVYELINGAYQLPESKKRLKILRYVENILAELPVLSYTQTAALWHGQETARLTRIGKSPSTIDAQIASVAKVNHLILVTRNTSDFENFADITLENWFIND